MHRQTWTDSLFYSGIIEFWPLGNPFQSCNLPKELLARLRGTAKQNRSRCGVRDDAGLGPDLTASTNPQMPGHCGLAADLNVIDPETVAPQMPRVVHDLPAGGKRIEQKATGIRATIVAGEVVHDDGKHTGALPGRLLRGRLASQKGSFNSR